MSILTRSLFTNACSKRIFVYNSFCNEIRLSYAQCGIYTNDLTKIQSKNVKYNNVDRREAFTWSNLSFGSKSINLYLSKIFEGTLNYLPVINAPKYTRIGFYWYKTLDEVKVEEFFTSFNMPDTFFSWFKVTELHVWMLLHALPEGHKTHHIVRQSVIKAMWEDCEKRAKMVKQINKNFKKNMKTLYDRFIVSLMVYDLGYYESDMSLASSVWYNFFSKKNVDPRYLEALVLFIRFQMHHLSSLNLQNSEENKDKTGIWCSVQPHMNEIIK